MLRAVGGGLSGLVEVLTELEAVVSSDEEGEEGLGGVGRYG